MSSLQRYKKTGGFTQLLSLIETFGAQKKEKFLEMIEGESPRWAKALRTHMITLDRIASWPDEVAIEVFKALPIRNMALALEGLKPEFKDRLMRYFSTSEKRRLDDVLAENQPKAEEISANMVKALELARKMITAGDLRPEKFDEALIIPEDIEVTLEQGEPWNPPGPAKVAGLTHVAHAPEAQHASGANGVSADIGQLQRALAAVAKENKALKEEVRTLRDKLEAIRKIA